MENNAPVAQPGTERRFPKPEDAGSNPAGGTIPLLTAEEFVKAQPLTSIDPSTLFYLSDYEFVEEGDWDYTVPSGIEGF